MKTNILLLLLILFSVSADISAQTQAPDFNKAEIENLTAAGKTDEALQKTNEILTRYYSENVVSDRLPNDFITIGSVEEAIDLNRMFRNRKNNLFFIKEDENLFFLHFTAAKCYLEMKDTNRALNNFYMALRYQKIEKKKSDIVFYEIARTFLGRGDMKAYYDCLETAYTLNPDNSEYSLELGKALYRTVFVKKSIFHLERYLESVTEKTDDLELYIMLAGLNEQIGRYLDTLKYYRLYLEQKSDDSFIWFAYGCVAYRNTGNFEIALESFSKAIESLPAEEIYKRSKSYEYTGDIFLKNLKFDQAVSAYESTKQFQDSIREKVNEKYTEINTIETEINKLKISLLKEKNFVTYNEYEFQLTERDRLQRELEELNYEFSRLNAGKITYNTAFCYEKLESYEKSIENYRICIEYDYKSNECRNRIIKLQLKIKRGY
ncbi:MAG: hypothetical protein JW982_14270 [Spirochaetes bacterium]|nr:hypothetical protein [Spirochaetota bacterium]